MKNTSAYAQNLYALSNKNFSLGVEQSVCQFGQRTFNFILSPRAVSIYPNLYVPLVFFDYILAADEPE